MTVHSKEALICAETASADVPESARVRHAPDRDEAAYVDVGAYRLGPNRPGHLPRSGLMEQSREREWEHHKELIEALSAIEEAARS